MAEQHSPGQGSAGGGRLLNRSRGYNVAKLTMSCGWHVLVNTDNRPVMTDPTTADVQDVAGVEESVATIRKYWPWLEHPFTGGACNGGKLMSAAACRGFAVEIVRKLAGERGFGILSHRWVVERAFNWMSRWRRLVRDCEQRRDVSKAIIRTGVSVFLLRHAAHA